MNLREIPYKGDAFELYLSLRRPGIPSVLLESVQNFGKAGRYSIIAVNPSRIVRSSTDSPDPFLETRRILQAKYSQPVPGAPPFLGGAIGFMSYETNRRIEPTLRAPEKDFLGLPDVYWLFFDEGVVLDHWMNKAVIFGKMKFRPIKRKIIPRYRELPKNIECLPGREQFMKNVKKAKDYIRKGDIFQANLSQCFRFPQKEDALSTYAKLRKVNPSPYFGFLDAGDFQILSGSPERLLKLEEGTLETRPIAGTRPRGKSAREDLKLASELILNEKERAEHVMLVDLERNDLGRVARYGSVSVDEFMVLEDYSHVKHIVSNVRGVLRDGLDAVDALKSFFPGGTITGTPKVRSMEIIAELEKTARGAYTGSLGYLAYNGNMDFNILIRSFVIKSGMAHVQVGAGIVADSDPKKEYDETLHKAKALFSAVFGEKRAGELCRRLGLTG